MGRIKYNYDKDGYDENGFTTYTQGAIHRDTGTKYNPEGFDKKGYDKEGYDKNGYNSEGYDREGYDRNGFHIYGLHKETGTSYNPAGYNRYGYNSAGYDKEGYDRIGFDMGGFDRKGIHKETGTRYNPAGYNIEGYDKDGYNIYGFSKEGLNRDTGTFYNKYGYDMYGYNEEGFNTSGFNKRGIHRFTGTRYGPSGYDEHGYDKNGFDYRKIHKDTKTSFDTEGFDIKGFDVEDYDRKGYNREGYNRRGFDRKGIHKKTGTTFDPKGFDTNGYNREGYDKNGYDRNGVNREGINRNTGEKDERVKFAEEFILSGMSMEAFAKNKQMSIEQVKAIIDEIRISAIVKEKLDRALERNANRFMFAVTKDKEQLLTGKITIRDVKGINSVLGFCNPDERKKVTDMLVQAIASHEISILQYKDILGIKQINSSLPQEIIMQIESLKRSAGPLAREFYKEMDRMKSYKAPYIPGEGETLGYMEKPTDKKPKMVTITDEHRDMARQYIKATGEFICNKTMQVTLMKIVKGEIGIEQIQRAQKESELRSLQQEDGELGELIEQSEQFIKASQGIAQQHSDTNGTRE